MEEVKFAVDSMLGRLARYLRILGYDTLYLFDDNSLIDACLEDRRILITRDKELYNRACKLNISCILIRSNNLKEQLKEVSMRIRLKFNEPRCPICNNILKTIEKSKVKDRVPEKVFVNNDKFLICDNCNKIYWYGKHWNGIRNNLRGIVL